MFVVRDETVGKFLFAICAKGLTDLCINMWLGTPQSVLLFLSIDCKPKLIAAQHRNISQERLHSVLSNLRSIDLRIRVNFDKNIVQTMPLLQKFELKMIFGAVKTIKSYLFSNK